jgi:hypothetical protein
LIMTLVLLLGSFLITGELTARVTKVKTSVSPGSFKGRCPKTFVFTGKIKSNTRGVVRYQWKRSDNANAPIKTIRFVRPGTKMVKTTWQIGKSYSGWQALQIIAPNKMMSNRAVFRLTCVGGKVATLKPGTFTQVKPIRPGTVRPGIIALACPDPAAYEIKFSIVRKLGSFRARVRVTGVIKNVKNKAFQSGRNQAKAYLYQVPAGASSGPVVAQREIRNLAPGGIINLIYERNWYSSSPSEGEFPPKYVLQILYDPDIYLDANKNNDDCNRKNNRKERSGADFNRMVGR